MSKLIWHEFKKLFLKRSVILILVLIAFFAYFSVLGTFSEHGGVVRLDDDSAQYNDDGKLLTGKEKKKYKKELIKEYAGKMDAKWLTRVEDDLIEARIQEAIMNVDEEAMIGAYGDDYQSMYEVNHNQFEMIEKASETPVEKGKLPFYIVSYDRNFHGSIRSELLFDMIQKSQPLVQKSWLDPTIEKHYDEEGKVHLFSDEIPSSAIQSKEGKEIFDKHMGETKSFIYDHYDGWTTIVNAMAQTRFLLAILVVFVCSRSFNYDHTSNTIDIIKASKHGKKKLVFAKLLVLLLSCISIVVIYSGIITMITYFMQGLGNWNTSITLMTNVVSPYSFKDAFLGGLLLLLAGSVCVAFVSALLSAIIKKGHFSFAISLLFLIVPIVMPNNITTLFPINYMDFSGIYFNYELAHVFGAYHMIPNIVCILSLITFIIISIIIAVYYRTYKYAYSDS